MSPHEGRAIVDYQSPEGPTITHVRGIMLMNSLGNLRELGLYDEYTRRMTPTDFDALAQSLATSWVPVRHAVAHYEVLDSFELGADQIKTMGERQATRITGTFLGSALRRVQSMGVDTFKQTMAQLNRLHDRMYRGGGCAAIDAGPKDLMVELSGFPFAGSRSFRGGWLAYTQALANAFCKVAYVRMARPREPHPLRVALTISWV